MDLVARLWREAAVQGMTIAVTAVTNLIIMFATKQFSLFGRMRCSDKD